MLIALVFPSILETLRNMIFSCMKKKREFPLAKFYESHLKDIFSLDFHNSLGVGFIGES